MKLLQSIDQQILAFWYTTPNERLWAYLATLPLVVLVLDGISQVFH
ncbi:hypothetical protein [Limosilactobacillus reuteri]|nr:hypothetical protein [Limosilactobacillus reuteri]